MQENEIIFYIDKHEHEELCFACREIIFVLENEFDLENLALALTAEPEEENHG
jgi:hypothetical protein